MGNLVVEAEAETVAVDNKRHVVHVFICQLIASQLPSSRNGELVCDAVLGEEDLAAAVGILGKASCVSVHEFALADGSDCLLFTCCGGALLEVKVADADTDGAGTYKKDFLAAVHEIGDRTTEPVDISQVHFAIVVCEGRSADLDDYSFRKVNGSA